MSFYIKKTSMNVDIYFSTYLQFLKFLYVISFFILSNDFVYMIKQSLKKSSLFDLLACGLYEKNVTTVSSKMRCLICVTFLKK